MACPIIDRYAWLDEVIAKIARVYADEFDLVPVDRENVYEQKHGSAIKCTYRFVFRERRPWVLPNEEGTQLMRLIKGAARAAKADPPLVSTRIKGQHDFCDWGFDEEGGFMWIFLQPEEDSKKSKPNRV